MLDTSVVYPTPPHNKIEESEQILNKLIDKYNVEAVSYTHLSGYIIFLNPKMSAFKFIL